MTKEVIEQFENLDYLGMDGALVGSRTVLVSLSYINKYFFDSDCVVLITPNYI